MCTARCLGDSACITGCFARFGNDVLNEGLKCWIEDYKCINIAIMEPGNDAPEEVPAPPLALATSFSTASMEGEWYKVLGWNRQYDCFDCQKNTFHDTAGGASAAQPATVDVDFSMISKKSGREAQSNEFKMHEKLLFDQEFVSSSTGGKMKSRRTAHTEGRMFGLTFWENWCVGAPRRARGASDPQPR